MEFRFFQKFSDVRTFTNHPPPPVRECPKFQNHPLPIFRTSFVDGPLGKNLTFGAPIEIYRRRRRVEFIGGGGVPAEAYRRPRLLVSLCSRSSHFRSRSLTCPSKLSMIISVDDAFSSITCRRVLNKSMLVERELIWDVIPASKRENIRSIVETSKP